MLYTRFLPVSRNIWEVTAPVTSTKPFATITRRRGRCSTTITAGYALNLEELACLLDFVADREKRT
jgi:hypothetical protein